MKVAVSILATIMISSFSIARAGDVRDLCEKTDLQVIDFKSRDRAQNLRLIKSLKLKSRRTGQFNFLREQIAAKVNDGNARFINESKLKEIFLKYATGSQKRDDPESFRETLLDLSKTLVPADLNKIDWFLNLSSTLPAIGKTAIRPSQNGELPGRAGGMFKSLATGPKTEDLEIIYSNETHEPVPYLILLLVHELSLAVGHVKSLPAVSDLRSAAPLEDLIASTAVAYDDQMKAYVALVRKEPELFCDWMYVSKSYGDVVVPLSWTMSSFENEMLNRKFLVNLLKRGTLPGGSILLNEDRATLRPEIQKRITALKLRCLK